MVFGRSNLRQAIMDAVRLTNPNRRSQDLWAKETSRVKVNIHEVPLALRRTSLSRCWELLIKGRSVPSALAPRRPLRAVTLLQDAYEPP